VQVGDPSKPGSHIGPVVSKLQFDRIQRLIGIGVAEGARVVVGGPGKPKGFETGYYVRPTVFADVNNQMTIAREEIFGPVLCMMRFKTPEEAIAIANDTPYGLAAYVQSGDLGRAREVARQLRAGSVHLNGAGQDYESPFGGFKQSGNGREWGKHGLTEYLELKSINGYYAA
jgi:aldehyde dehydrogenase (NAD+)